jgi:hypothetical protein
MNNMSKRALRCAVVTTIGLAAVGCERIGSGGSVPETAAIPAALGDLVAVTPTDQRWESILWFRQSDQTIVAVRVNVAKGTTYIAKTKYPRN